MGIFGRSKNAAPGGGRGTGYVGSFLSPHSPDDTARIVHAGLAGQLSNESAEVTGPGLLESIYLSRFDSSGITVVAGNSVDTYFSFAVDLTATSAGTEGRAHLDRPARSVKRWMGNTIKISSGVQIALEGAGVQIVSWDIGF
ncbi:hypothetical protein [Streptomyces sp. NBC_00459]|uniref:hypothetical protein n=1 Tax=Streptomyces sp. NBC_00459 TaxID=2975749 RepID=UPI002E176B77